MKYVILLTILLTGCTSSFRTYDMGDLKVKVGSKRAIVHAYKGYMDRGFKNPRNIDNDAVLGFYVKNENVIYTVRDFDVLLHEMWHAQGHKEEPNF